MAGNVKVILVHGIGIQTPGSVERAWGTQLLEELSDQSKVTLEEFNWHERVPIRSAARVTFRLLFDLPWQIFLATRLLAHNQSLGIEEKRTVRAFGRCLTLLPFAVFIVSLQTLLAVLDPFIATLTVRRIRLGRLILSQTLGDAQLYLLEHDSLTTVAMELQETITLSLRDSRQVVLVAHSQGAAIAYSALNRMSRRASNRVRLITVGGGHHLLSALSDSQSHPLRSVLRILSGFLAAYGAIMWTLSILSAGSFFLLLAVGAVSGYVDSDVIALVLRLNAANLAFILIMQSTIWTFFGLLVITFAYWGSDYRPLTTQSPRCEVVQVWSRFDPVTLGTGPLSRPLMRRYCPGRRHGVQSVEVWGLRWPWLPITEHVDYFRRGSTSLSLVAREIDGVCGAQSPSPLRIPAEPGILRKGNVLGLLSRQGSLVAGWIGLMTLLFVVGFYVFLPQLGR